MKANKSDGKIAQKFPCTHEEPCKGDFDCTGKIEEADEMLFKSDLGRSQNNNPCPTCAEGE